MKLNPTLVNEIIFLVLIGILGYACLSLFTPFLPVIFISLIVVIFYHPVYKFLKKISKSSVLSSLLTTFIVIVSLLIPILLIFSVAASQVNDVTDSVINTLTGEGALSQDSKDQAIKVIRDGLNKLGISGDLSQPDINWGSILTNPNLINEVVPILLSTISAFADFIFKAFILLFITLFLFVEFENLPKYLVKFSPLENRIDELLFDKFVKTIKTIIKGSFFVAMIQATLILIPMASFGIPGAAIWWIIMFILSIVPVGAGAVSIPIGLFMVFSPDYPTYQGIFLIVYSVLSINLVDNLVRPQLTKEGTGLHPMMILLSGIGGIIVFSTPLGLVYGQLIAVFYKTVIEVYQEKYPSHEIKDSK